MITIVVPALYTQRIKYFFLCLRQSDMRFRWFLDAKKQDSIESQDASPMGNDADSKDSPVLRALASVKDAFRIRYMPLPVHWCLLKFDAEKGQTRITY